MTSYTQHSPSVITYLSPSKQTSKIKKFKPKSNHESYGRSIIPITSPGNDSADELLSNSNDNYDEFLAKVQVKAKKHRRVSSMFSNKHAKSKLSKNRKSKTKSSK